MYGGYGIESVENSDNVVEIGERAFYEDKLTEIIIGDSAEEIKNGLSMATTWERGNHR